jgi:ribonuclease BN (tRNA processing enzyme)
VRVGDAAPIILDAGTGIRGLGQRLAGQDDDRPLHLFLTHRHSDHVLGLAHFAPLFRSRREISVCCGDGEREPLSSFVTALLSPPLFPAVAGITTRLAMHDWEACRARESDAARMHRFTARHPGDAAIFRVDDAHGPVMAYAPDNELAYHDTDEALTAWRHALVTFLRGVPVLVHDATYRHEELPRVAGWGHSSATEATRLAMACEAGTLVLFHHHPDRDDDAIDRILDEAREQVRQAGSALTVLAAWEGLELSV